MSVPRTLARSGMLGMGFYLLPSSPDILGGVPTLRGQLPALGVIHRGMQDGDAHVPRLCRDRRAGSVPTPAPAAPTTEAGRGRLTS